MRLNQRSTGNKLASVGKSVIRNRCNCSPARVKKVDGEQMGEGYGTYCCPTSNGVKTLLQSHFGGFTTWRKKSRLDEMSRSMKFIYFFERKYFISVIIGWSYFQEEDSQVRFSRLDWWAKRYFLVNTSYYSKHYMVQDQPTPPCLPCYWFQFQLFKVHNQKSVNDPDINYVVYIHVDKPFYAHAENTRLKVSTV